MALSTGVAWTATIWCKWAARTAGQFLFARPSWSDGIPPEFDRDRAIFIHIPKTAGTALIRTLGWTMPSHVEWHRHKLAYPHKFAAYWSFAFVRNPWDRLVSAYHFLMQGGLTPLDQAWAEAHLRRYPDFESFIREGLGLPAVQAQYHFRPQVGFICDERDQVRIDWVGRYEFLERDLRVVAARLKRDIRLPRVNSSQHGSFRDYYTTETAQIVGDTYAADCRIFGYRWDG